MREPDSPLTIAIKRLVDRSTDALITRDTDGSIVNVTGALLSIAKGLHRIADALDIDRVSHATCMGIRKGLFGANADASRSILEIKRYED